MGFSRQERWSGLACPPPGDLSNSGIQLVSLKSPALAGGFFTISASWHLGNGPCVNSLLDRLLRSVGSFISVTFMKGMSRRGGDGSERRGDLEEEPRGRLEGLYPGGRGLGEQGVGVV